MSLEKLVNGDFIYPQLFDKFNNLVDEVSGLTINSGTTVNGDYLPLSSFTSYSANTLNLINEVSGTTQNQLNTKLNITDFNGYSGSTTPYNPSSSTIGNSLTLLNQPINTGDTINVFANKTQGQIDAIKGVSITVAELQALITANNAAPSTLYRITDSVHGGNIFIRSISTNSLEQIGIWQRNTDLKAFGSIGLISGSSGSVDSITVNGVNQMTAPVAYTTSLANTAQLVCNNINANVNATWRAVRCDTQIVLESKTPGVAFNGLTVAGTSTTLVLGSTFATKYGYDPSIINLNVTYDITTDSLLRCSDNKNNIIEDANNTANGIYNNFRWGDPRGLNDNYINSNNHVDVFLYNDSYFYQFNEFRNASFMRNVFVAGTGGNTAITTLSCYDLTSIEQVCLISSVGSAFLSFSVLSNFCRYRNITMRSASGNCGSTGNAITGYGFLLETVNWNAGACTISGICATGYLNAIRNVTGTSTGSLSIFANFFSGRNGQITNITCNSTGTYQIQRNNIQGDSTQIASLTFSSTGTCGLYSSNIIGASSLISTINFAVADSTINNVSIIAPSATYGGFNIDSTLTVINGVTWYIGSYALAYTTPTMNNTANRGAINSPITLGYIPNKFYITSSYVEGSALASSSNSATIEIGIDTQNTEAFMQATPITSLNGTILAPSTTRTKATAVRKIVAIPKVEDLTAGTFRLVLQGAIGI